MWGVGNKGETGKGHERTRIKDTWRKPKGVQLRRGGGNEWGGVECCQKIGGNCTWTKESENKILKSLICNSQPVLYVPRRNK